MHIRKQMVVRVVQGEMTVSEASREYEVTRQTVRRWVTRAQEDSLANLAERSRRPYNIPRATDMEFQERILELKAKRPAWGAKKLVAKLWPQDAPLSVRTADRILARHGLVAHRGQPAQPVLRFERERSNELLQMDFKGLGSPRLTYSPLSVIDDATRFCLALRPLPDHKGSTIFNALWDLFEVYGLPEAILCDNEPCFHETDSYGPSMLEANLWLLGIRTLHGRPRHPQTQGKVERFHRTLEDEHGAELRQADPQVAKRIYDEWVHDYNYERPHESLDMRTPGQLYKPSTRARPDRMPEHEPDDGALLRKVDTCGKFRFKMGSYRAGGGLAGQYVELREEQEGFSVYFANKKIRSLNSLQV